MYPAGLASPPWVLPVLVFSGEAALCSFHLFDAFASFKSQPKSNPLTRPPLALSEDTLVCPITHQVSGHLVICMGVCWLTHCLLPLPGYPRKEGHGPVCLSSHTQLLENHRSISRCSPRALMQKKICFNSDVNETLPSSCSCCGDGRGNTLLLCRTGGRTVVVRRGQAA